MMWKTLSTFLENEIHLFICYLNTRTDIFIFFNIENVLESSLFDYNFFLFYNQIIHVYNIIIKYSEN